MTKMPLAERRQQLVEAAIAVMIREGVHKATTRAIMAEAGTEPGRGRELAAVEELGRQLWARTDPDLEAARAR